MHTVYFILDITGLEPKISGTPFVQIRDNNNLHLQMLRDVSFSGVLEKNRKIHFLLISTQISKKSDYLFVASQFLKEYAKNSEDAFSDLFRFEKEIYYTIDPDNSIQNYSNATIKFNLDRIVENNKVMWYYSNPDICINRNN